MAKPPEAGKLCIVCLAAMLAVSCAVSPPVQEMSAARQALAAAEEAGADRFAPDEIAAARRFLADAEAAIAARAYGPARTNALRAQDRAMGALRRSQSGEPGE
jgi:hypothetical protein